VSSSASRWQPGPRPQWVSSLNTLGAAEWVRLDEAELLAEAQRNTGLSDFGGDAFREPLRVFLDSIERESNLHLIGRVLARGDVLNLLENRLQMTETRRRHPEIDAESIERPIFITGLPRTGTSILHEVLGCDPSNRVPLTWEVRHPCPPPEAASYESDPRIALAQQEIGFWNEVVPEYGGMHELGAQIPVECIMLTQHSFVSDQLCGAQQVPSYAAWLATADMQPAYAYHKQMLQLLQWKAPGERWVLKAPSHLGQIEALLAVYPDARIVQTHRDPLTVMASAMSILFATAWVRSDEIDADAMLGWFSGENCAHLLNGASALRDSGRLAKEAVFDMRYRDFVEDPITGVGTLYAHFGIDFEAPAEDRMRAYLESKPKGGRGGHRYSFEDTGFDEHAERQRFAEYQERYGVPSEI
jgi:hypothetical protein